MTGVRPIRGPTAWVVDPDRCRMCGREDVGLRCDQCVTPGYERQLVRVRTGQRREGTTPWAGSAPCGDACPLSLCIQGYANHIAAGEYAEALRHVMVRTALPESVCRVCDRPCEEVCVRAGIDESVAINDLKRFVVEWAKAQPSWPWVPVSEPPNGKRVAVVGAGPAGLSAAQDLRLRGYEVTVFDASDRPGGVLAQCIPEYRLPTEALEGDLSRIRALGVELVLDTALGRDITLDGLLSDGWDSVFLAVGAHQPRLLSIEGAGASGAPPVVAALHWLKEVRRGTDELLTGRVVVIGGGNAAIDAARTALRRGAEIVHVACIEGRTEMPALPEEVQVAEREGIVIHAGVRPVRLVEGAIHVASVDGEPAEDRVLEADRVIAAIGQDPGRDHLAVGGGSLACDGDGVLAVDAETCRTSHPRIFAGGDVCPGERTVTSAMAAGLRAAWALDRVHRGEELADVRRPPLRPRRDVTPRPEIRTRHVARRHPPEASPLERTADFAEVVGALSEAEARLEASRCMVCGLCGNCRACIDLFGCPALHVRSGKVVIDPGLCNGCGVCVDFCPNDAIRPATPGAGS